MEGRLRPSFSLQDGHECPFTDRCEPTWRQPGWGGAENSSGERDRAKVRRQASILPLPFRDRGIAGDFGGGGFDRVSGCVPGVISNVSCCGGMTGGACGSPGSNRIGVASGSMGSEGGSARVRHRQIATRPRTRGLNRLARSVVSRARLLEVREHVLSAVCRPDRQQSVRRFVEPLDTLNDAPAPDSLSKTGGHLGETVFHAQDDPSPGKG